MSVSQWIRMSMPSNRVTGAEAAGCRTQERAPYWLWKQARQVSHRLVMQTAATPPLRILHLTRTGKELPAILGGMRQMSHLLDSTR